MKRWHSQGFTIVELMIVIVVVGILTTLTVVGYGAYRQSVDRSNIEARVLDIGTKLEQYRSQQGSFPNALTTLEGYSPSDAINDTYIYDTGSDQYCVSSATGDITYMMTATSSKPAEGTCDDFTPLQATANQPTDCPSGFIPVPGNAAFDTAGGFCVMKYEAKAEEGIEIVPISVPGGLPWVNISQTTALTHAQYACEGCHLITENEWMTIAANVLSVTENWSGGGIGSGSIYRGHSDNSPASLLQASSNDADGYFGTGNSSGDQRRTLRLTNGEIIWDLAGNAREWTSGTINGTRQPGLTADSASANNGVAKEWNNPAMVWDQLSVQSRPAAISAAAANWSSTQGIGRLYSNFNSNDGTRAFQRGGSYGSSLSAGVLSLYTHLGVSDTNSHIGFRVAR